MPFVDGARATGSAAVAAAVSAHVAAWRAVWTARAAAGAAFLSATPEYGPAPYTPPAAAVLCAAGERASPSPDDKAAAAAAEGLWTQTQAGATHLRAEHAAWATGLPLAGLARG